ncbi:MAG: MurR/RpiR family transcriptional regulator [Spirochaetales bacterium]
MSHDWLDRLRQSEDELSRSERVIIDYVNRRPERAAFLNQQELAGEAGVSKPVVISCFRKLGYESFREFQNGLEQFFATQIDSLSASRQVTERVHSLTELVAEASAVDTRTLQRLATSLDTSLLEELAGRMHGARTVAVVGQSTGHLAAHYLSQRLSRYGVATTLFSQDERHLPEALHPLTSEDILIAFHYSDDDTWLYRLAQTRAARGSWTAVISATIHPDYVDGADLFVHVPRGEIGFKNSMAVPLHFANLILLSYELIYRDEVNEHLTKLESTRRVLQDESGKNQNGKE